MPMFSGHGTSTARRRNRVNQMPITILTLGSIGDILPYAFLGKALHAAGYRVRLVSAENYRSLATRYDLDFHPIPGDAQAMVRAAGANMPRLMWDMAKLSKGFPEGLDQLGPVFRESDLILNQLPGGVFGYDLVEKYGSKMIMAAVIPLLRTSAFPMMGWPHKLAWLPGYNWWSYRLSEKMAWQLLRPTINRWRETLDLPKASFWGYIGEVQARRMPVLNGFSAHVVPRPPDWPAHVHITGYWFDDDEEWQPPDALMRFIDTGPPPVFVGFGSMPVREPERTTQTILDALRRCGQRAVLHAGWAGLGDVPLPDAIFKIDYAPYGWLFPRMAAVVHHGGSGTTALGLRAGVPTVLVPLLFDQFYWGRRIVALGVGPEPAPFRRLSAGRLASAIERAVSDREMRERAAALGRRILAEDGIGEAESIIKGVMDSL
jgi:UDP:flavonoid glycosyltransferase YjiC (YdhE family)